MTEIADIVHGISEFVHASGGDLLVGEAHIGKQKLDLREAGITNQVGYIEECGLTDLRHHPEELESAFRECIGGEVAEQVILAAGANLYVVV